MTETVETDNSAVWPRIRQVLIFQIKLYVDALRDLLFSPLSILALVMDLLTGQHGEHSYFQRLLRLGRRTEYTINLFNQYDEQAPGQPSIDGMLDRAEEKLRREFEQKKRR